MGVVVTGVTQAKGDGNSLETPQSVRGRGRRALGPKAQAGGSPIRQPTAPSTGSLQCLLCAGL